MYGREITVCLRYSYIRACLKNHSCNLHASIYSIFYLHSVDVARYAALIQAKSPTNCNAHLTESIDFLLMYYHYNDIMSYKEAAYMGKFKGADFADKTVYLLWTRRPSRNYAKAGMNHPVGVKTAHSCGHTSS